jgi:hypothetical protein
MLQPRKVLRASVIIAVIVIVLRIVLEQAGAPESVNNILGVAWMYFVLPVLFALGIVKTLDTGRYKALLKYVFLFALYTRLIVMGTYMLAYFFRWTAPRFSAAMGGNVGDNISAVNGVLLIPLRNAAIWIMMATLLGMIIGTVVLLIKRRSVAGATA